MAKLILGEKRVDLTSKGSLMKLTIEELIWTSRSVKKGFSFKEHLIDYILKINQ